MCGLASLIRTLFDPCVHVATTNAYLAERDRKEIKPIFDYLSIDSAFIGPESKPEHIRAAYRKQVVYGPGYIFGFDYLRDQLLIRKDEDLSLGREVLEAINGTDLADQLSQTGHFTIIVDEADSVLIDESTTPLLLSGPPKEDTSDSALDAYRHALQISQRLNEGEHFQVDSVLRQVALKEPALDKIHEELAQIGRLHLTQPWPKYIENALYAEHFLLRDEHYVVEDDQIKLVDQNTGRIFEDRALRGGLHQALEAKEGVQINAPNETMARVTRQRFFQLYHTVCGMTGTATGSENELEYFYGAPVIPLAPNKPNKRIEMADRYFADWDSKLQAIVKEIKSRQGSGQPILVGTRTIHESNRIGEALAVIGIESTVLNGIQDEDEAEIVSRAGQANSICIATNMAGRGTDIKLTDKSRDAGGLHVICASRHESRRVDRQLAGRSARQGAPGSCQFFVSADDPLLQLHSRRLGQFIESNCDQNGECHLALADKIEQLQSLIEQKKFEQRRQLVQYDNWMNHVRETMVQS